MAERTSVAAAAGGGGPTRVSGSSWNYDCDFIDTTDKEVRFKTAGENPNEHKKGIHFAYTDVGSSSTGATGTWKDWHGEYNTDGVNDWEPDLFTLSSSSSSGGTNTIADAATIYMWQTDGTAVGSFNSPFFTSSATPIIITLAI